MTTERTLVIDDSAENANWLRKYRHRNGEYSGNTKHRFFHDSPMELVEEAPEVPEPIDDAKLFGDEPPVIEKDKAEDDARDNLSEDLQILEALLRKAEEDHERPEDDTKYSTKVVIHDSLGRVLILWDAYSDPPYADLPGGHKKEDEQLEAALRREVFEEAQLVLPDNIESFYEARYTTEEGTNGVRVYFQATMSDAPTPTLSHEHLGFTWATPEELPSMNLGWHRYVLTGQEEPLTPFPTEAPRPVTPKPLIDFTAPIDISSLALYEWIDEQLGKSGMELGGAQAHGAKTVGRGIELHLYASLNEVISAYLSSLVGTETVLEVNEGLAQALKEWAKVNEMAADLAFQRLFKLGVNAGAVSEFKGGKLGSNDQNTFDVLTEGKYRIGERIKMFADDAVKEFAKVIKDAYTPEGEFSVDAMTKKMREAVPAQRYALERIARTETSNATALGRLFAWENDTDRDYYDYRWNATPDNRTREMKRIRAAGNPYSFSELKFLWFHNHQQLPNGKWQLGAANCRCSSSRTPRDTPLVGNRFEGQEHRFRRTVDISF